MRIETKRVIYTHEASDCERRNWSGSLLLWWTRLYKVTVKKMGPSGKLATKRGTLCAQLSR